MRISDWSFRRVLFRSLGIVAGKPVALANDAVFHLACGGELEAFFDAALRLELGHFRLLSCDVYGRPRHRKGRGLLNSKAWWQRNASRSEEHTSELQSLMRISYAVFCLKKKKKRQQEHNT